MSRGGVGLRGLVDGVVSGDLSRGGVGLRGLFDVVVVGGWVWSGGNPFVFFFLDGLGGFLVSEKPSFEGGGKMVG